MAITTNMLIQRQRSIQLVFVVSLIILILLALFVIKNLLVSFLLALVTHAFLAPVVNGLERQGFPRLIAVIVPFVVFAGAIFVFSEIFFPVLAEQTKSLQNSVPQYLTALNQFTSHVESSVNSTLAHIYPIDLRARIEPKIIEWTKSAFESLPDLLSRSLTVIFLTPFLAFFMLLDGRDFTKKILSLVPNNVFELALHLHHQITSQISGFIRARVVQSFLIFLIIATGLLILGFPYALVLAVFAGILNVIPYLGPVIGFAPALIIHIALGGDSSQLLWLFLIYGGAQILDSILIVPFIVAKIVDLHPITVVLAIIVGAQFMGMLGMIISIPVASALKVSISSIYRHLTDFRV